MGIYLGQYKNDYSAMRGPCPDGYHIPTYNEHVSLINIMQTLEIPYSTDYEFYLHMPFRGGMRKYEDGSVDYTTQSNYWTCSKSSNAGYAWYLTGSTGGAVTVSNNGYGRRARGSHIRPFRDTLITLDSPNVLSYAQTYSGTGDAGVYEFTLTSGEIVVSITADGVSWITIANKNLGATTMYISGDTASEANCGKFYQWGNNYGFPFSGSITTSSTRVDASSYGPGNYYSSSTFITNSTNPADWSSVQNDNLRGGETGLLPGAVDNIYIGGWRNGLLGYRPLQSDLLDVSGNGNNASWYSGTGSFSTVGNKTGARITRNTSTAVSTQHIVTPIVYTNKEVSVLGWINYDSNSMQNQTWTGFCSSSKFVEDKDNYGTYSQIGLRGPDSYKLYCSIQGGDNTLISGTPTSGTRYFYAMTCSGTKMRFYVNNNLAYSTDSYNSTGATGQRPWRFGTWAGTVGTNGYVRHCAIWDRILSEDEMSQFYNYTS